MISVVIPAFNEEQYLANTIASVRGQLVPHEIIVVCNGCTDSTEKIAKKLADRVIVLKERGVSRARNAGAKAAKYDMLVFLDADTLLSPKVFQEIVKKQGYGVARGWTESGKVKDYLFFFFKEFTQLFRSSSGLIFTSKNIFYRTGGFNERISKFEDGKFLRRAGKFGSFHLLWTPVYTSTRRYEKKGYFGTMFFWIREYFFPSKEEYDAVR